MSQGKVITLVLAVLGLVVLGLAWMNKDTLIDQRQVNNEAIFAVVSGEETIKTYTMSEIVAMGEVTFDANLKSSGEDIVVHKYTGVLLKSILEDAGVSLGGGNAIVSAIDGYVVAVSNGKLMAEDNVYLAYRMDGELIGTREEGGEGPYQMIISKDKFSQYWCKYAYSVELKQ